MLNFFLDGSKRLLQSPVYIKSLQNLHTYQVLLARKPAWVPIAKSKIFRIPQGPVQPQDEREETLRHTHIYYTHVKALWSYQRNVYLTELAERESGAIKISEEGEFEKIFQANERENERVKEIRKKALIEEWREYEKEVLIIKMQKEEQQRQQEEATEQFLLSEMERLKTAIKLENLDAVIEKAMDMQVDYNYAISPDGSVYRGRHNSVNSENIPIPNEPIINHQEV